MSGYNFSSPVPVSDFDFRRSVRFFRRFPMRLILSLAKLINLLYESDFGLFPVCSRLTLYRMQTRGKHLGKNRCKSRSPALRKAKAPRARSYRLSPSHCTPPSCRSAFQITWSVSTPMWVTSTNGAASSPRSIRATSVCARSTPKRVASSQSGVRAYRVTLQEK